MTSEKEARIVSPKGNPDDIVVTIKQSWKYWVAVTLAGAAGALLGGLGVHWLVG